MILFPINLDYGVRGELEGAHNKQKNAKDILVTLDEGDGSEVNLRLDLVRSHCTRGPQLDKRERERNQSENRKKKNEVVAIEKVIWHCGGVVEPECLGGGEAPAKRRLSLRYSGVRYHEMGVGEDFAKQPLTFWILALQSSVGDVVEASRERGRKDSFWKLLAFGVWLTKLLIYRDV